MKDGKKPLDSNNIEDTGVGLQKPSKIEDLRRSIKEFWEEFKQVRYGIVGIVLLVVFILIVLLEPFIIPFSQAGSRWSDISYWQDNPRNAAPLWVNWLSSEKRAVHEILHEPVWNETETPQFTVLEGEFVYNYNYDIPPSEFTFKALSKGNTVIEGEIIRPDGETIRLFKKNFHSNNQMEIRISFEKEIRDRVISFGRTHESREISNNINTHSLKTYDILFSSAEEGILEKPTPLKGDYQINITAAVVGDGYIQEPELIVSGRVSGLMGTDDSKRDVWSGIVAGMKWALFIGLMTAFVSVAIGVIYGITMAYFGSWVDSAMSRVHEIFVSIPMIPLLIVLSALYKPSIWNLIFIMCLLYWTGPVRTVRSMAFQIKEETYVEAAHALNASDARIIFKHMLPQLIPYSFASMALAVPGAIVAEASISLLGLGDASIVTWGQILHTAMNNSAVLKGLWWWVVPPGLMIALVGMTFAFIGFSMDKILNPKLKTR